ncbi:MAG: hypothetical protein PF692_08765 [Kiritimatiellae bacterium]|jgi:hypothetical protein|nr:hypothetical protein [Kiritimatiellia bacterium]
MVDFKQSEVSKAVWPWCQKDDGVNASNIKKAMIQFVVMICIGGLLYYKFHKEIMSYVVFALAWVVFISGIALPKVFNAIEKFGSFLGMAVGTIITWALLLPFFFICFVPGRIILLLAKKDPLERNFDKDAETYFTPYTRHTKPEYYKNQF